MPQRRVQYQFVKQGSGPRLGLYWLGHPRVELSGSHVRLETRKTTALLAYLSLNEHPQSREKLAALFWPEFDQNRAPANLRRSLASLHASIPGDWLEPERDRISVRSDADLWIDVRAARRLVADVKAHPHESGERCPECLERVVNAIRLFQGEFLEGFNLPGCPGFDDWQVAERESLRAELGWLLERSARCHAAAERWEDALQSVKRWLAQDRMHEQAQALLIQTLALSGQRSAAIRQYEEFAEALRGEFGQEPEKGTRDLYNQILSRQIGPREKTKDTPRAGPGESNAQLTGSKSRERCSRPRRAQIFSRACSAPSFRFHPFAMEWSEEAGSSASSSRAWRAAWWSYPLRLVLARRQSFLNWLRGPGCLSPGSHSMRETMISPASCSTSQLRS